MDEHQPTPPDDIAAQGAPASPDALRQIVAKHQRARTRTLGIFLAIALVAGPIAGWAVGHSGGGGTQVATGSSTDKPGGANPAAPNAAGSSVGGVSGEAFAYPGGNPPKATHLFTRTTADGVTIRAYRQDPPTPPAGGTPPTTTASPNGQQTVCPKPMTVKPGAPASGSSGGEAGTSTGGAQTQTEPAPPPQGAVVNGGPPPPCAPGEPPACKAAPTVLAELSNDAAVAQYFDPIDDKQPSDALSHLAVGSFGVPEGSPATFVTVQTGAGVATVRLRLPSGTTDQMAPSGGVAVLALSGSQPPPDGTVVEALDGSGKVLQSMPVGQSGPRMGFLCGGAGTVRAFQGSSETAPPTPPITR